MTRRASGPLESNRCSPEKRVKLRFAILLISGCKIPEGVPGSGAADPWGRITLLTDDRAVGGLAGNHRTADTSQLLFK